VRQFLRTREHLRVVVEAGAGAGAHHPDAAYEDAGAEVADRDAVFAADLVAVVQAPTDDLDRLADGQLLVGFLDPLGAPETARTLADRGVTALAMELVPRISRAQKMDALSAMGSLAGYRAVLVAAHRLPKFFPLLTTAAGTIRPANALVLGAGVAGLQAIATAKRLGARVSGYDIRDATREEVESLGATFVELELDTEGSQDEGGYARELEKAKQERQPELLKPHVAKASVVVTTAQIPGRRAPILVSEAAVEAMAPGSVIVDMAAPGGGNCALTEPGATVERHGVTICGPLNLPAEMPVHASQLYAKTVAALVEQFYAEDDEDGGRFTLDFDDAILDEACLTHDGTVRNDRVREAVESSGA
jgi:NAD(P) transhydrogenase subunit alpha